MQAELLAKEAELQRASASSQKVLEEAEGRATSARKEAEEWSREAEDRRMQLSVLMETMETLQTGSLGQPLSCSLYLYVPAPIAIALAQTRTRRTTADDSSFLSLTGFISQPKTCFSTGGPPFVQII